VKRGEISGGKFGVDCPASLFAVRSTDREGQLRGYGANITFCGGAEKIEGPSELE